MANKRIFSDTENIRRAWDVLEIKNVMGRHAYMHAYDMHEEELDTIWVAEPENMMTASFGQNWGYQVGMDLIRKNYAELNNIWRRSDLETLIAADGSIEHTPDNLGIGTMVMHTLTTPYVEVAGDGATAHGMWYSPGIISVAQPDGIESMWIYEIYSVDFIKEGGEWKIWHLFIGTDFILKPGELMSQQPVSNTEEIMIGPEGIELTIPCNAYSSRHNWTPYPRIPKPHETFDAATGNGPEGNPAAARLI